MDKQERFFHASIEEMKAGYVFELDQDSYCCLICGERFENGEIFKDTQTGRFFNAEKYAARHVQAVHGSMLDYLLELDKKAIGLTDLQKLLVRGFASDVADADLMKVAGIGSASTIRNHRFVLKEKKRQAKLLLALLELMDEGVRGAHEFVPIHSTATMVDERYALTGKEYQDILQSYFPFGPDGPLSSFPKKEKRKVAVLKHITSRLDNNKIYSEKELNTFLKGIWEEDYVVLRRYLIEYGFMDRRDDGSSYWVKKSSESLDAKAIEEGVEQHKSTTEEKSKKKAKKAGEQSKQVKEDGKMDKSQRKQLVMEYQDKERSMGVFQIKNEVNGKVYIGSSTNLDSLWGREQFILNMGTHKNHLLQKEWKQFGGENFSYLVLKTVKFDQKVKYDYKDVMQNESQDARQVIHQYNKEVAKLLEEWLEKLQPYDEKGYHVASKKS